MIMTALRVFSRTRNSPTLRKCSSHVWVKYRCLHLKSWIRCLTGCCNNYFTMKKLTSQLRSPGRRSVPNSPPSSNLHPAWVRTLQAICGVQNRSLSRPQTRLTIDLTQRKASSSSISKLTWNKCQVEERGRPWRSQPLSLTIRLILENESSSGSRIIPRPIWVNR